MMHLLAQLSEGNPDTSSWIPVIETHWSSLIPLWLVVLLTLAVGVLMVLLYLAQRKVASTGVILLLIALRGLLLLLILAMIFQPSVLWTTVHRSPGTLWLLLDQSGSMALRDPQATAVEKLRWADALGLLPDSKRKSKPDILAARLYALQRLSDTLKPAVSYDASLSPEADRADVAAFVERMKDFSARLDALADDIDGDSQVGTGRKLGDNVRRAARMVEEGVKAARSEANLKAAITRFNWNDLQTNLRLDSGTLIGLADRLDAEYLAAHAGDSAVETAIARVSAMSRSDMVTELLTSDQRQKGAMSEMLGQFRVRVVSFADGAQNVGELDPATRDQMLRGALVPGGKSTSISAALQLVGEQTPQGEKSSVVLVTDARQNVPGEPTEAARILASRGVHVFGLLIGSQQLSADAAVEQVDAPDWIFKDDTLQIGATVRMDGLAGKSADVELFRGNSLVDRQHINAATNTETPRLKFTDKPGEPGVYDYEIRVSEVPGEVNLANNRQAFRVAVKKDKLTALMIEDVPRWEFQYISNFLARDQRMKLQTVLFSPATIQGVTPPEKVKASPTNPKREAQILPETRDEWQAFDIVMLGDVTPEQLPREQQQFLATAVRDRGTTLIVLAGPRSMPARFSDTPLADLLPVRMTSEWGADAVRRHLTEGFRPGIAPQGADTVLTQLGMDTSSNAQAWSIMPPWFWHSEQTTAKDAASVIWTITDPADPAAATLEGSRKRALLASMTIGRGRVLYLASDQTWRLRQIQGDNLQERFWGQVIRWAAGTSLPAGGRFVRFGAEPQHAVQGTPITVTARVFHEDLTPYGGLPFEAVAAEKGGKPVDRVTMKESPGDPGTYKGTFAGLPSGNLEISLVGAEVQRLLDNDATVMLRSVAVQIEPQLDLEHTNVDTNPELLASIASAGAGVSLNGPYADVLAGVVPRTPVVRTTTTQVGLFTDPKSGWTWWVHGVLLGIFALILAIEWSVRKRAGMV